MPERWAWITPDGTAHDLHDDANVAVLKGVQGRFMAPVEHVTDDVPGEAGSRLREVRVRDGQVVVPVAVKARDEVELRERLRVWVDRFAPDRGDGRLRVTGPAGDQRELVCRYASGLEGDESRDNRGYWVQKAAIVLRAFDPYWYAVSDVAETFTPPAPATFFPIFPLRLSGSEVFADATVDNSGDVDTWPVITIVGPGVHPVVANLTSDERIELDVTLAAGDVIVVDTRPGVKSVRAGDGSNLFGALVNSTLWSLRRGSNAVRVEMSGATAASSVRVAHRPRWRSA